MPLPKGEARIKMKKAKADATGTVSESTYRSGHRGRGD